MSTLLLCLAAPMQSWGSDSKYNTRRTNREPTKSGVLGLLAAALGCRRDDNAVLARLNRLRFGVRMDREGTLLQDFHMAHGIDEKGKKESTLSYRDYLCDAVFVVGLEGEKELLLKLREALLHPAFPLFLGRRSCPPAGPVYLSLTENSLEEALREEPWQGKSWRNNQAPDKLRMMLEVDSGAVQHDVPISFSPFHRKYDYRYVHEEWLSLPDVDSFATEHDPMAEL